MLESQTGETPHFKVSVILDSLAVAVHIYQIYELIRSATLLFVNGLKKTGLKIQRNYKVPFERVLGNRLGEALKVAEKCGKTSLLFLSLLFLSLEGKGCNWKLYFT